ncbi:TrmH family RNA methyltransferase [Pedobacter sp. SAFR-022]|uniref:TrmH family RNA methyltransferase n=1 Tax=Pedobacter sp. SAFR-022 TaxID=3436861 RepID=UPI003F7E3868
MLSKSQIGFIKSLHQKKYRKAHGLFIVEGLKTLMEFFSSKYQIQSIYYLPQYQSLLPKLASNIKLFEVNNAELEKISTLQAPQGILALIAIPENHVIAPEALSAGFSLVLDGIQDPGNMGTIIRTADWFGFKHIICSTNTVEVFNPKTVQATMGSLARVDICYTSLPTYLQHLKIPVYAAMLDGENLYQVEWQQEGLVVLGNEGQGISDEVANLISSKITIPRIGAAESLNVSISAAIICAEISRNLYK